MADENKTFGPKGNFVEKYDTTQKYDSENGSGKSHTPDTTRPDLMAQVQKDLTLEKIRGKVDGDENLVSIASTDKLFTNSNSPWDGNNWDNAIKSNVDFQDDELIDDLGDGTNDVASSAFNTLAQGAANTGVVKGAKNLLSIINKNSSSSEVPKGTSSDDKFTLLRKEKTKKFKNVKILSSRLGLFNSIENLLGSAAGMMVGAMGTGAATNLTDDMTSKFTGGLGIAGMLERLEATVENIPTAEELVALNLANYYNMYSAKPGRLVKDRTKELASYISNDPLLPQDPSKINALDKGINAAKETVGGVAKTISSWMGTASDFVSGKKITDKLSQNNSGGLDYDEQTKTSRQITLEPASAETVKNMYFIDIEDKQKIHKDKRLTTSELLFETNEDRPKKTKISELQTAIAVDNKEKYNTVLDDPKNRTTLINKIKEGTTTIKYKEKDFEPVVGETKQPEENSGYNKVEDKRTIVISSNRDSPEIETDTIRRVLVSKIQMDENCYDRENNSIGCLYIEPYYSNGKISVDNIPFEFNPTINDGGLEAKYDTEELMGRLLSVRSYVGTDSSTLSIEAKYLALHNQDSDIPYSELEGWMKTWTPAKLEEIERKYRSLVYPYINGSTFVRPPIVRIKLSGDTDYANDKTIGELFSYPIKNGSTAIQVTSSMDSFTKEKRYIVINVNINPLNQEDFSTSYYLGTNTAFKRGFVVSLTLAETTKNFLDTVPNYYHYANYTAEGLMQNNNNKTQIEALNTSSNLNGILGLKVDKLKIEESKDLFDVNNISREKTLNNLIIAAYNGELGK